MIYNYFIISRKITFTLNKKIPDVSKKMLKHFYKYGWCFVSKFFTNDEIKSLHGALADLVEDGSLANVSTKGDGKTYNEIPRSLQICPLMSKQSFFKIITFHPRISSTIHQLLCDRNNSESGCCYLSQTFWKPAKEGEGTSWHQDNAYFLIPNRRKSLGIWIPIHDSSIANGTLEICDSRDEILTHIRDLNSDHHITCNVYINDFTATSIELNLGGVIFFDYNTPHRTNINKTKEPRAAIAFHFLNQENFVNRKFPLPEKSEWITPVVCGPNNTLGMGEYGFIIWTDQGFVKGCKNMKQKYKKYTKIKHKTVKQDQ